MNKKNKIFDIVLIAMLTSVLFVQEQVLTFLPNIQLTVFLIVLYTKCFGFIKTVIIVCVHVVLDNLYMGSISFIYTPSMLIGWLAIPILLTTVFKKANSNISLAFLGVLFSFIYSWIMAIPPVFISNVNIFVYLSGDLSFELLLAASSFLSILLLYDPCVKCLNKLRCED